MDRRNSIFSGVSVWQIVRSRNVVSGEAKPHAHKRFVFVRDQRVDISGVEFGQRLAGVQWKLELAVVEAVSVVKEVEDRPPVRSELVTVNETCICIRNLALNDQVRVRMRLNVLHLVPEIIHESVQSCFLGIGLCVLQRELSVVRNGRSVVVPAVHDLHSLELSGNSRADVEEDQEPVAWVVLRRADLVARRSRKSCARRKLSSRNLLRHWRLA